MDKIGKSGPEDRSNSNMENNMTTISIDFSVLTNDDSSCSISGNITVTDVPQQGDRLSFQFSEMYWDVFDNDKYINCVTGSFTVTHRAMSIGQAAMPIMVLLSDVHVPSGDDARNVGKYFEAAHNLSFYMDK